LYGEITLQKMSMVSGPNDGIDGFGVINWK